MQDSRSMQSVVYIPIITRQNVHVTWRDAACSLGYSTTAWQTHVYFSLAAITAQYGI